MQPSNPSSGRRSPPGIFSRSVLIDRLGVVTISSQSEIPTGSIDGHEGQVARIDGRKTYQLALEPNTKEYTEQLTGYMRVRLTGSTLVSQSSVPGDDLVERVDEYYIHLKPPGRR
jgi:hypothetical protein